MGSPIFNALGNRVPMPNNMATMMQKFAQFRQSFSGDPKAEVQKLLDSGKMTQEQFNQLSNAANMFRQMLGK